MIDDRDGESREQVSEKQRKRQNQRKIDKERQRERDKLPDLIKAKQDQAYLILGWEMAKKS